MFLILFTRAHRVTITNGALSLTVEGPLPSGSGAPPHGPAGHQKWSPTTGPEAKESIRPSL